MPEILALCVLAIYLLCLVFLFANSLIQLSLTISYLRFRRQAGSDEFPPLSSWPKVTVQLPVYNEPCVIRRLINTVCQLDYPREKLEIQVLDDSTDETTAIAREITRAYAAKGMRIEHLCRSSRAGFKAGALAHGLKLCDGEFIAIFDADFVPPHNFLRQMIPHCLSAENIGAVQARWTHINQNHSLITRLQAFGLDGHFTVEQSGRSAAGHFINFNGTGGIWRKAAITDAGGWQSDTLTEDLDLSYRAQLRGWRLLYVPSVQVPAELPQNMPDLRTQQFRWTKGAAENLRKNLLHVLKSPETAPSHKVHATFHLLSALIFPAAWLASLLSLPVLIIHNAHPEYANFFYIGSACLSSFLILGLFYWSSLSDTSFAGKFLHFIRMFPLFICSTMGLSLQNARASFEGLTGKKTAFVRTPKLAGQFQLQPAEHPTAHSLRSRLSAGEPFMALYFLGGIALAFKLNEFGMLPFHLMLTAGYTMVSYFSFRR
jgi:cellulose synthase/poly-beta-1,6-N-acetylglucosamine synthase-like glycosyltransferase